jgi:predicted RNase H-like HicB family nuclease
MKYPVLIHKEDETEYGVTIPDIPGCFTLGKSVDDAIRNVQDAVEL